MMRELGIEDFTFVDTWHDYELIEFNYIKMNDQFKRVLTRPLCHFISEDVELHSELHITKHLLNFALNHGDSLLALIVDSDGFYLADNPERKPMIEDFGLGSHHFDYEEIFPRFLKMTGTVDPQISLAETMNLVFHRMATLHTKALGEKPKSVSELFDFEKAPAESFAWDILKDFATKETEAEFHPYIQRSLRAWVERGTTRIADQMLRMLQIYQFDRTKIEKARREIKERRKRHS
jgi:hypothetical protein